MRLGVCVCLLALIGALALDGVAATRTSASRPKITSVKFTGGPGNPHVTVHGVNLGARPVPNPSYQPLGHPPLCPPQPTRAASAYGFDYGTMLFLWDRTQHPVWSAGRYRPNLNELDCIGLIVTKFTPTLVVFRPDAFYRDAHVGNPKGDYHLAGGDLYVVGVNGARFTGHVTYK